MSRWLILSLVAFFLIILGCGGGGGGIAPATVTLEGNIFWIETGAATDPQATVRVGEVSGVTDVVDGYFNLEVPAGSTSLTVTFVPNGGSPVVQTFTFPALSTSTDLGELYIGPETVTVAGTVVDSSTLTPVPAATVKIAGRSALTGADGSFAITDVAYSSSTLSVFLGLQGTITKTGYFAGNFSPPSGASGGIVNVGTLQLTPEGSSDPPPLPFNVSGTVTPGGAGATLVAKQGTVIIRTTTVDALNNYKLWLPAGTYDLEATKGSLTGTTQVTVVQVNQPVTAHVILN